MQVIILLFASLQLLLHQQSVILVNGEGVGGAVSSGQKVLANDNANIPTNFPTNVKKESSSDDKLLYANGGNGTSSTTKLSRNVTPTDTQANSKGDSGNSTKSDGGLTLVAPNVVMDRIGSKSNETGGDDMKSVNGSLSVSNIASTDNKTATTTTTTTASPVAKIDEGPQKENNSMEVRSTNGTVLIVPPVTTIINATTTATTTTTTSTTTTPTTTPKPKKASITYGLGDYPRLPGEPSVVIYKAPENSGSKLPVSNEAVVPPNAQLSQELSSGFNYQNSRDYIVPIMTVLFTIPLAIGVMITTYRRFRDCWSTRHYRRMDFLVDGMYND